MRIHRMNTIRQQVARANQRRTSVIRYEHRSARTAVGEIVPAALGLMDAIFSRLGSLPDEIDKLVVQSGVVDQPKSASSEKRQDIQVDRRPPPDRTSHIASLLY